MKKMITLLFATGLITVAFAQDSRYGQKNQQPYNGNQGQQNSVYQGQPNSGYQNNVVRNDRRFDDHFNRERDEQIARINRDFDYKASSINHRWFMSREKKNWEIHNLEMQKQQQINEVFARFSGHGDFHHDGFAQNRHF